MQISPRAPTRPSMVMRRAYVLLALLPAAAALVLRPAPPRARAILLSEGVAKHLLSLTNVKRDVGEKVGLCDRSLVLDSNRVSSVAAAQLL